MKKKIVIILILLLVIIAAVYWFAVRFLVSLEVPEKIIIEGVGVNKNNQQWEFNLGLSSPFLGSGCDTIKPLFTQEEVRENTVIVNILGHRPYKTPSGIHCMALVKAYKNIKLNLGSTLPAKEIEVIIVLKGQENKFSLLVEEYIRRIVGKHLVNAEFVSWLKDIKGYFVFPRDVGVLSVSGYIDPKEDYHSDIKRIAKEQNLSLIEEWYPDIAAELPDFKGRIFIVDREGKWVNHPEWEKRSFFVSKLDDEGKIDVNIVWPGHGIVAIK